MVTPSFFPLGSMTHSMCRFGTLLFAAFGTLGFVLVCAPGRKEQSTSIAYLFYRQMANEGLTPNKKEEVADDRVAQNFAEKDSRLSLARLGIDAFPAPLTSSTRVSHITILTVKHNALPLVPSELFLCLTQLKELDCSENCISYLPETIGLATGLRKLNLASNRLRNIPDGLGLLHALEALNLTQNLLEGLPRAIGGWKSLQRLDLASNLLKEIPPEANFLVKLKHIDLRGNPVQQMPLAIERLQTKVELKRSKARRQKLVRRALNVRGAVRAAFTDECLRDGR